MNQTDVFLSLGGNIGNSKKILLSALDEISKSNEIELIKKSHFYKTSPVSPISQRYFINLACHIKTTLSPELLLKRLEEIEKKLGKVPKNKSSPRIVDIDIIFFGNLKISKDELTIPHKEWKKRLFVLKPLSDLQDLFYLPEENGQITLFDIKKYLKNFKNVNNEKVIAVD